MVSGRYMVRQALLILYNTRKVIRVFMSKLFLKLRYSSKACLQMLQENFVYVESLFEGVFISLMVWPPQKWKDEVKGHSPYKPFGGHRPVGCTKTERPAIT